VPGVQRPGDRLHPRQPCTARFCLLAGQQRLERAASPQVMQHRPILAFVDRLPPEEAVSHSTHTRSLRQMDQRGERFLVEGSA
jgi:hypothetical protein